MVGARTYQGSGAAAYENLSALVQAPFRDALCVQLTAVQCPNLLMALTAFVAKGVLQAAHVWEPALRAAFPEDAQIEEKVGTRRSALEKICTTYDASDLALLEAYLATAFAEHGAPTVVLFLYGLESFLAAPLQDFAQAVLGWSHEVQASTGTAPLSLVLLYTASVPVLPRARMPSELIDASHWLPTLFSQHVLAQMDMVEQAFPDKSVFWERVICPFFLQPASGVWLGQSVFALVRRRYWHVEASWEGVAQTVRLAYLHHFTTSPLSAFVHTLPSRAALAQHWTAEIDDTLRLALVSAHMASAADTPLSPTLQTWAQDTDRLLDAMPQIQAQLDVASAWRVVLLSAVQALLDQANMREMHGTRLSYSACVATALALPVPHTDWNVGRLPAYALTPTTPSAAQLRTLLCHLARTMQRSDLTALVPALETQLHACAGAMPPAGAAAVAEALRALHTVRAARDAAAQPGEALAQWIEQSWHTMHAAAPRGIGAAIWTYDFADPLSSALEGAARAGILLALDAPAETLASMYAAAHTASGQSLAAPESDWPERAMGVSDLDELRAVLAEVHNADAPDVCRLYALYKDSGKFINLADWFDAFRQSLEGSARAKGETLEADTGPWQLRFALALNELAYLGLLGPTGRKVEHVCRTVWDLPIEGMPGV